VAGRPSRGGGRRHGHGKPSAASNRSSARPDARSTHWDRPGDATGVVPTRNSSACRCVTITRSPAIGSEADAHSQRRTPRPVRRDSTTRGSADRASVGTSQTSSFRGPRLDSYESPPTAVAETETSNRLIGFVQQQTSFRLSGPEPVPNHPRPVGRRRRGPYKETAWSRPTRRTSIYERPIRSGRSSPVARSRIRSSYEPRRR